MLKNESKPIFLSGNLDMKELEKIGQVVHTCATKNEATGHSS
jgi:hypothetical protein